MKYIVFNQDGDPVRMGFCPDHMVEQQANEGETALELTGSVNCRLVDGEIVYDPPSDT